MILEVSNLKKTFKQNFKKIEVLRWVSLSLEKWEIFWFIWPNGAWKTTTLKCILDFIIADEGDVLIFWKKLSKNREILKRIWFAPEQVYYYDYLTWEEFLNFMWSLSWLDEKVLKERSPEILEKVWLKFAGKKYIKTYSKWMRQRLWIASSIIHDPELVFFDEPMSWLDPLWRNLIKNIILELKKKWTTVFFNTHILSDVQEIADNFAIVNQWRVIYYDEIRSVKWQLENFFVEKISEDDNKINIR